MAIRKDIIVDPKDDNDLVIYNGDFFIAFSDFQHVAHIVEADQGQYKQWPLVGCGIRRYLNGDIDGTVRRKIQLQLEGDGMKTRNITFADGELNIEL